MITDVNVNKLHQPWRSFAAVINKCLSECRLCLPSMGGLCLSSRVKNVKRSNEMYYPRFTKVIVNFFMTKDQSIPRRNKVNWHFARDDYMFTTIKFVSRHEDTQLYGAILLDKLTNEAIKDLESYKEYYAIASGAEPPKTKASVKKKQVGSDMSKMPLTKGKRLKTSAKAAKTTKKKQPEKTSKAKGLTMLSKVALTEAEQMKLATKRSLIQTHISHASGLGADKGTGDIPGVPDVPTYGSDNKQIFWKSSEEDDDDEVVVNDDDDDNDDNNDDADNQDDDGKEYDEHDDEEQSDDDKPTDSDNDGDDFVHPNDEEIQDANVEGDKDDLEGRQNEEAEVDSKYRTSERRIFRYDICLSRPLLSATTLPPPPTPLITHLQQTPVPTPPTVSSSSLKDLPNFGSLFRFDHRLQTLENNFLEFNQTNQFAAAVSLIPDIIDAYLANKMHEAIKTIVRLQSKRLKDEAQAENADFVNN
ncbi:hypothetical protein Tco_0053268 [Tanacetum coccineum]